MNKHAYLIIAHDKYVQLQFLVSLLDNPHNDIYIHIDKSSPLPIINVNKSNLYMIVGKDAIDVRWGDVSQIQTEILLYETAFRSNQNYCYYHLLSGYCVPIKSMEYIHSFFDKYKGLNFIGFGQYAEESFIERISRRHYITKKYREKSIFKRNFYKFIRIILELSLNVFLTSKRNPAIEYKKGSNWCSLTHEFVEYILDNKKFLLKHYDRSFCADEVYKQTLIWNSHFKNTIFDCNNEFKGCMRLIDWNRGTPYVFGGDLNDLSIIKNTPYLFARKFDIIKYPEMECFIRMLVTNNC